MSLSIVRRLMPAHCFLLAFLATVAPASSDAYEEGVDDTHPQVRTILAAHPGQDLVICIAGCPDESRDIVYARSRRLARLQEFRQPAGKASTEQPKRSRGRAAALPEPTDARATGEAAKSRRGRALPIEAKPPASSVDKPGEEAVGSAPASTKSRISGPRAARPMPNANSTSAAAPVAAPVMAPEPRVWVRASAAGMLEQSFSNSPSMTAKAKAAPPAPVLRGTAEPIDPSAADTPPPQPLPSKSPMGQPPLRKSDIGSGHEVVLAALRNWPGQFGSAITWFPRSTATAAAIG